ncbi:zincin-like metallopeptidase domain-containing protein [Bacteroides ovatus]|uniref:zincin-like metallopeptidase domain-containing protein n=1 Tax=Bacteroides ovatus TaxID=28116 RepID=UPI0021665F30|nr:ArdC-like ssDNA-binding domain-containing protein [Bacteroides ovatus]MCS2930616.1 zincin-like metallopeptidase domain-containing protein [Bacteroides ovatus]
MKEKSTIEKKAEEKQIVLLSTALSEASNAGGHWLNATGKGYPRFYPRGVSVSPFNALFMGLHSDRNGCKTNLFTLYSDAKARGTSVREHEQGVPFLFYNWNKYVHRNNPEEIISREAYLKLDEEQKKQYKGIHNREIRTLFNIDQTTLPYVEKEAYDAILLRDGSAVERGYTEADSRRLHTRFNNFLLKMRDNLVPVRSDGSGMPHYETDKDAVYMPRQRDFEHYNDYVQEALRQIVSATGHQQRLAREGMVMKNGMPPSEDAVKLERLVVEVASGIKMLDLGLPARLSEESLQLVDFWNRELKENPNLMDALESDVNNALEVIHKAEEGEKIEYATLRNRRQTSDMREQMPKHYFVADEIRQHPNKENKTIVIVIDPSSKSADVILPAGASPEVDNEIPGMNKARIGRALRREGIEHVRFFNPDGAWGYRPDDGYFAEKQVTLARLKNWSLEMLSTLNVTPAVKRADEISFDQVQMIQDDKKRWALYIKPENQSGYSIYPDKEDVNRFFSTLKQAMDNIDKVRMELGHKYYALAETQPDLKVDLFSTEVQDIDLNRIQRVSVFKSRQEGAQCVATIDGKKLQPRSVTPQQWQRMWLAEDRNEYKRNLAATLFADVLRKGQTQEETAGKKQEQEDSMRQNEEVVSKQVDASIQESDLSKNELPVRDIPAQVYERYERLKAEQPETVVLLKHEGKHYASMYDAETVAHELSLPPEKERLPYDPNKLIVMFEHDNEETRKHIAALKAYVLDCGTVIKEGQEARADITDEQNENERHSNMRR